MEPVKKDDKTTKDNPSVKGVDLFETDQPDVKKMKIKDLDKLTDEQINNLSEKENKELLEDNINGLVNHFLKHHPKPYRIRYGASCDFRKPHKSPYNNINKK